MAPEVDDAVPDRIDTEVVEEEMLSAQSKNRGVAAAAVETLPPLLKVPQYLA